MEFQINKYITLKLEYNRTNIYVDGMLFRQCKYLLLNLNMADIPEYDEIKSIDEAMDVYNKKQSIDETFKLYDRKHERNKMILDPETEFIGHCSNIQAWVENDYNIDILHSKLSLPLLRRLVLLGDKKARIVIKEVIAEILVEGGERAIIYFLVDTDLDCLSLFELEELEVLFDNVDIESQEILRMINKFMNRRRIIDNLKKLKHININLEERGVGDY